MGKVLLPGTQVTARHSNICNHNTVRQTQVDPGGSRFSERLSLKKQRWSVVEKTPHASPWPQHAQATHMCTPHTQEHVEQLLYCVQGCIWAYLNLNTSALQVVL